VTDVVVKLDIYPADALMGDSGTTYRNVRVAVADDEVQVWRNESAGPAIVFRAPLIGWAGSIRTGYELATPDTVIVAGRNGGCLCGAQLGTANLWPGMRRVNTSLA
jgi:hypothetical protein